MEFRRVVKTGSITGEEVYSTENEKVGKVDEIMLDFTTGRVAYVILATGGFLGMGNKLFAIPWQAFQIDEPNKRFNLTIPKTTLENAPGFDKDSWPDMSSDEFGNQIYSYYGYKWS